MDYYSHSLPNHLQTLYTENVKDDRGTSIAVCQSREVAEELLAYSNRCREQCELIGVFSKNLADAHPVINVVDGLLKSSGFDPFQLGGGTLLLQGLFADPEQFPGWMLKLNCNGLFNSVDDASEYIAAYLRLAIEGLVEDVFPLEDCPVDPVEVYHFRGSDCVRG